VIAFLEDRRVLYTPDELEVPSTASIPLQVPFSAPVGDLFSAYLIVLIRWKQPPPISKIVTLL
jgi:hypothetical protein